MSGHAISFGFFQMPLESQGAISFESVSDVAVSELGEIYLLTRESAAVVVYGPDGSYRRSWSPPYMRLPHGITIEESGRVFVVDQGAHAVWIFSPDGERVGVIGHPDVPSGTGIDWELPRYKDRYLSIRQSAGPFNNPTKLVPAPDGSYFVTDGYGNCRVHHFSPDLELLDSWGTPGSGPGEFRLPHGVCLLADGRLLVADRENERIQCFQSVGSGGGAGELIEIWEDFQRPAAIVESRFGYLIVGELGWKAGDYSFAQGEMAEAVPPRLTVVDQAGSVLARHVHRGEQPGPLSSPHGLAETYDGTVVVAQLKPSPASDPGSAPPRLSEFLLTVVLHLPEEVGIPGTHPVSSQAS
jgi:hypothetical protein